jgi:uncharacterized protein (DUF433 family)
MDMTTITPVSIDHIALDGKGRPFFVKHPRMRVEFILPFFNDGISASAMVEVHEAYDFLTPGEILAALSYFEDHKSEVEKQIERDNEDAERIFSAMDEKNATVLERFRKLNAQRKNESAETDDRRRG